MPDVLVGAGYMIAVIMLVIGACGAMNDSRNTYPFWCFVVALAITGAHEVLG